MAFLREERQRTKSQDLGEQKEHESNAHEDWREASSGCSGLLTPPESRNYQFPGIALQFLLRYSKEVPKRRREKEREKGRVTESPVKPSRKTPWGIGMNACELCFCVFDRSFSSAQWDLDLVSHTKSKSPCHARFL